MEISMQHKLRYAVLEVLHLGRLLTSNHPGVLVGSLVDMEGFYGTKVQDIFFQKMLLRDPKLYPGTVPRRQKHVVLTQKLVFGNRILTKHEKKR